DHEAKDVAELARLEQSISGPSRPGRERAHRSRITREYFHELTVGELPEGAGSVSDGQRRRLTLQVQFAMEHDRHGPSVALRQAARECRSADCRRPFDTVGPPLGGHSSPANIRLLRREADRLRNDENGTRRAHDHALRCAAPERPARSCRTARPEDYRSEE